MFSENLFDFSEYFNRTFNPLQVLSIIVDIIIFIFLIVYFVKLLRKTRAGQLLKGIALLLVIKFLSNILNLKILNFITTTMTTYGLIALLIIFQPELRRALEQLGSSSFFRFIGFEQNIVEKTKEDIYKVIIAIQELSKTKTGGLIVFERDIKLKDTIDTGIEMNSIISPQLIVNIFTPKTPLHDGAIVISENKIAAVGCILPLADDKDIAKELGTRHRSAIGISKESDCLAIVISEETGKVSIAKDGTLIADIKEDALKRILIQYLVISKFGTDKKENKFKKLKEFTKTKHKIKKEKQEN